MSKNIIKGKIFAGKLFTGKIIPIIIATTVGTTGGVIYSKMQANEKSSQQLSIEPNVVIQEDTKNIQEVLDRENQRVKEGMLAISMTPEPTFYSGSSLGKVMIKNPAQNTKNFTVKFVMNSTNEEVYKSGLIPPGGVLEEAKLNKNLPKGSYSATAYFESYDENNEKAGEVGFDINIKVLN